MKKIFYPFKALLVPFLLMLLASFSYSQTQMPITAHGSVYSGMARGLWFEAPTQMTIVGLKVAPEAGTGLQYIHFMKVLDPTPVVYSSTSSNFATLAYISGAPNNTMAPVNVTVQQGDILLILGTVTGNANSYSTSSSNHTSQIGSHTVSIGRAGTQSGIESAPASNYWTYPVTDDKTLGRVFLYYQLGGPADAGLETFVFPADTVCEGVTDVTVRLKNHGPDPLFNVDIEWLVNNTLQTTYQWSGTLGVNDSDDVNVGSYDFQSATSYSIKAYTSEPNNDVDTLNNLNDTITRSLGLVKPSPTFSPDDTSFVICVGDSFELKGVFTGVAPWDLKLNDGKNTIAFNSITSSPFSAYLKPTVSTEYMIEEVVDATGCININPIKISVATQPAPPATITAVGSPSACAGDSVVLMASVGLNLNYEWFKDGNPIPGKSTYVCAAKEAGDYFVKVTTSNGCSNISDPITVYIHPLPTVFIGNDTSLALGAYIILDAGPGFNSYSWSTGSTSQKVQVDTAGYGPGVRTIWVVVKDNNSCPGSDTIKINFSATPGIENVLTDANIQIAPNPAKGMFEITTISSLTEEVVVQIYSLEGQLLHKLAYNKGAGEYRHEVDAQFLADGVYMLQITTSEGSLTRKLAIRR